MSILPLILLVYTTTLPERLLLLISVGLIVLVLVMLRSLKWLLIILGLLSARPSVIGTFHINNLFKNFVSQIHILLHVLIHDNLLGVNCGLLIGKTK